MIYYNNVSSYRFLVFAVICYLMFLAATIFVLTSDFVTGNMVKAKILKLDADHKYLINIDYAKIKNASLVIVIGNKIKIYDHKETSITPTADGNYKVSVPDKESSHSSQADLLYVFPHHD